MRFFRNYCIFILYYTANIYIFYLKTRKNTKNIHFIYKKISIFANKYTKMFTGDKFDESLKTLDGKDVYTTEYIDWLRKSEEDAVDSKHIIPQLGGQQNMLGINVDILIGGGSRGGSKTFSLLMEALKNIYNKDFKAIIFRKEVDDLANIIDESKKLFQEFGEYNKSKSDMTWNLNNGGAIKFNYYSDNYEDFKVRFQGKQYSYMGVDEITHMEYNKFKYLITCNRNAYKIRNRFWGTCNPDPDSWVAQFIDWWIGEDGYPIPERNGVIRYCFMDGDDVSTTYWGNTRDEVYEQCKETIDRHWKPEYNQYGTPQELFIKSVSFVEAKLSDNRKLMKSDPNYLGNLMQQDDEQRARDLDGNWKYRSVGDDLIKLSNMENFYKNSFHYDDNHRRCSCDVAYDGGDNLVMWLWIGNHIQDIHVDSATAPNILQNVKNKLEEWQVLEEDFTYDLSGLGQTFKGFFPKAMPFNNRESVDDKFKAQYDNIKSQCAYLFYHDFNNGEISINPDLLDLKFSGDGYKNLSLRDILNKERKAIKKNIEQSDKGFCIIKKQVMKKIVGHSPDFIEAMLMMYIFKLKKHKTKHIKGLGWLN